MFTAATAQPYGRTLHRRGIDIHCRHTFDVAVDRLAIIRAREMEMCAITDEIHLLEIEVAYPQLRVLLNRTHTL